MRLSKIKSAARIALERTGLRPAPIKPPNAHELRQQQMERSFGFFAQMAGQPGIAAVAFETGGSIVTLDDGRRYHFEMDNKAGRLYSVPFTGSFEPIETRFVRKAVQRGDVCIDVGANFGWYTLLLSQAAGPDGHVHAFEPIPPTADLLRRNVSLNGATNVTIETAALDETESTRELFVADVGVSGSFVQLPYRDSFDTFRAQTMTLDSYVRHHNLPRVDFIKADIEGAEWSMLKGGADTLRRFRPTLMVEVQASSTRLFGHEPSDVFDWLAELGYDAHVVQDSGALVTVDQDGDFAADYNFIFLPRGLTKARAA